MKIIKIILLTIVAIIALVLIVALFTDKDYKVEKNIVVNKPKQEVFNYLKIVKNQENYNKWTIADSNMKTEYRGTDGTVGFIYYWNGNDEVGEGEQEIKKISEGERIDLELRFKRPFESKGDAFMATESISPTQTKVTWTMQGHSNYPMNFMNNFTNSMIGNTIQESLELLKTNLEK